jgi:hypothetical protein
MQVSFSLAIPLLRALLLAVLYDTLPMNDDGAPEVSAAPDSSCSGVETGRPVSEWRSDDEQR